MKSFITELVFCILMTGFIIISGCHNDAIENSQYGNDAKPDTNVNGAAKTTDMEYGIVKQEEDFGHGNPAAHNQKNVDNNSIKGIQSDSSINPLNNPGALQKSNKALSGTGESGHAPASKPLTPADDPNNKAKRDTVKYK